MQDAGKYPVAAIVEGKQKHRGAFWGSPGDRRSVRELLHRMESCTVCARECRKWTKAPGNRGSPGGWGGNASSPLSDSELEGGADAWVSAGRNGFASAPNCEGVGDSWPVPRSRVPRMNSRLRTHPATHHLPLFPSSTSTRPPTVPRYSPPPPRRLENRRSLAALARTRQRNAAESH